MATRRVTWASPSTCAVRALPLHRVRRLRDSPLEGHMLLMSEAIRGHQRSSEAINSKGTHATARTPALTSLTRRGTRNREWYHKTGGTRCRLLCRWPLLSRPPSCLVGPYPLGRDAESCAEYLRVLARRVSLRARPFLIICDHVCEPPVRCPGCR